MMIKIKHIAVLAIVASLMASCEDSFHQELDYYTLSVIDNASLATVVTDEMVKVVAASAEVSGSILSFGNSELIEAGFVIGKDHNPTLESFSKCMYYEQPTEKGQYKITFEDLDFETQYFFRAYAVNKVGVAYGNEVSFLTFSSIPTVMTDKITEIGTTSASVQITVKDSGAAKAVTEYGVVWSTSPEPTLENGKRRMYGGYYSSSQLPKTETYSVTGLTDGTKYYIRAYATNEKGTGYGEVMDFTTVGIIPPSVSSASVTTIRTTSAEVKYTVDDSGNAESITESGVVWSTSPEPTLENGLHQAYKLTLGDNNSYKRISFPRSFTVSISGLTEGTKYYLRAYATNEKGTGYGEVIEFTTVGMNVPSVTTNKITEFGWTTAIDVKYTVNDSGNADSITESGVVWSTSPDPTLQSGSHLAYNLSNGGSYKRTALPSSFTVTISSLWSGTEYYLRAYATNEKGTGYGEVIEFNRVQ